jgi:chromatin segregation and condensation protein Rec8/ScpA/Scc1 (kleisin family)
VEDAVDTAAVYQRRRRHWYSVLEARARILALLAQAPEGGRLEQFLPEVAEAAMTGEEIRSRVRRGLAWGCTFVASLELAKQGDLTLAQEGLFELIQVRPPAAALPPPWTASHRTCSTRAMNGFRRVWQLRQKDAAVPGA